MPESKLAKDTSKAQKDGIEPGKVSKKADKPGLLPDESMEDAARKVLAYYFHTMLTFEPIIRRGLAPEPDQPPVDLTEPIHDMRVTTRRLRSALRLFAPFLPKKKVKRFRKTLGDIGTALGEVRDLDVLGIKAGKYMETLTEERRQELAALLGDWHSRLLVAKESLRAVLDSTAYEHFTMEFAQFVTVTSGRPREISAQPTAARHVVPRLIYEQYGIVRAYETVLENAPLDLLHDLRIQAKRLRYMLDSFEEILGGDVKTVIEAVKALQDHLGDLQDARVANQLMREYTSRVDERQSTAAVLQYMAVREAEIQQLLTEVQGAWKAFTRAEVRRSLAMSVSKL